MRLLARRGCVIGSWLLLAAVSTQLLLAGLGTFVSSAFFEWHSSVGSGSVALFALVVLGSAALGRVRGAVRTGAEIFGLVIVQWLLLFAGIVALVAEQGLLLPLTDVTSWLPKILALHALPTMLILLLALRLVWRLTGQGRTA
jgi:hypothetical protein